MKLFKAHTTIKVIGTDNLGADVFYIKSTRWLRVWQDINRASMVENWKTNDRSTYTRVTVSKINESDFWSWNIGIIWHLFKELIMSHALLSERNNREVVNLSSY